jgi:hypothetical protein
MIARNGTLGDAEAGLHYVAPLGEKEAFVARALAVIAPFLQAAEPAAA